MAFNWPGKKEIREPGAKPEFPAALAAEIAERARRQGRESIRDEGPALGDPRDSPAPVRRGQRSLARPDATAGDPRQVARRGQGAGHFLSLAPRVASRRATIVSRRWPAKSMPWPNGSNRDPAAAGGSIRSSTPSTARSTSWPTLPPAAAAAQRSAGEGGGSGPSEAALESAVRPVGEKLEQFEARLKSIDALKEALVAAITKLRDAHAEQHNTLGRRHPPDRRDGAAIFQCPAAVLHGHPAASGCRPTARRRGAAGNHRNPSSAAAREPASAGPAVGGDWQEALLGGELAHNPALNLDKNQLLNGVLSGDPGGLRPGGKPPAVPRRRGRQDAAAAEGHRRGLLSLAAQDLRTAPANWRRPSSSGSCGPATRPAWPTPSSWSIPGERFDSLRHNASRPGVEITQVLGWIVLRDNGKVYTKASVAVK